MRQKSIFCSLTFWGIALSYLNSLLPMIKVGNMEGYNFDFYISLIETTILFIIPIIGRYNANSKIYTPYAVPGRNRKDLLKSRK